MNINEEMLEQSQSIVLSKGVQAANLPRIERRIIEVFIHQTLPVTDTWQEFQTRPGDLSNDILTGLETHRALHEKGPGLIARTLAEGRIGCVVMLDLNGIQAVNDTLGYHKGDRVLADTATILKKYAGKRDIVVRAGGDEFAMILTGLSRNVATELMSQLYFETSALWPSSLRFESKGISAGMAWFPDEGSSLENLLVQADFRMYIDKRNRRTQNILRIEAEGEGLLAQS